MRVTSIRVRNFLGLAEWDLDVGRVVRIAGANGTGKTSALEAFKAALHGGNLARFQRVGAEDEPETVLVLDDGALLVERKGGRTKVLQRVGDTAAYEAVKRPQAFLTGLFDAELTNPVRFLTAKPEEQAALLLEAMPLTLNLERVLAIVAGLADEVPPGHPLEVLGQLRAKLYEARTGVNVSADDKQRSAHELLKTLPAEVPVDPAAHVVELRTRRDGLKDALTTRRAEVSSKERRDLEQTSSDHEAIERSVREELKTKAAKRRQVLAEAIAALQSEAEADIGGYREAADVALDAAEDARAEAERQARAHAEEARQALRADEQQLLDAEVALGAAERDRDHATTIRANRALADRLGREAQELQEQSSRLTAAMDRLDAYKLELARDLPIPGLSVEGRQVLLQGVPFHQVNTAARIRVAVQVAALRAKSQLLPVVFVDGAEALDAEHQAELEAAMVESGVQAFIARVDDGPLRAERVA